MTAAPPPSASPSSSSPGPGGLQRRLGLGAAVVIGLGSMIGAGVFSAFAPAAAAAGDLLLVSLLIAGVVAFCNATSTAQLAAQHPTSGGAYAFGRERLGEWPGFVAGWGFVVGKTASCAAMATTAAVALVPDPWTRPAALLLVVAVTALNAAGITRTAAATAVIVAAVLAVLVLVVVVVGSAPPGVGAVVDAASGAGSAGGASAGPTPVAVLQGAGLLFFAFAGYARIATLAEEVRRPSVTIPRAVVIALSAALVVYAAVALVLLRALGSAGTAASERPLVDAVEAAGAEWLAPVVAVATGVAASGALLALVAGIGRTSLAMAREGDLPRALAVVDARRGVPLRAELVLAAVVGVLVLTVDLRGVIGASSFGVLVYYLVANLAALTQTGEHRRWPRVLPVLGAVACVALVVTLPVASVVAGVGVFAVGVLGRLVVLRRRRGSPGAGRGGSRTTGL
ncbi:APA family basic amino acid/polyamine antiporter [Frigoribacterium sp. PvP120]|uniref:APC family permease n=1 Tax=unclassified Frigoribacterium TaxID=2627005 RepID=UPI001AE9C366|nr:APC family permease [Frigoribacterium sp. PvP121]MBP1240114.1 APA family basic amino acid/polyamine antiporter [Frigoribacterium sp. PvP121]